MSVYLGKVEGPCGRIIKDLCKGPVAEVVPALSEEQEAVQSGWEESREQWLEFWKESKGIKERRQIMPSILDHFNHFTHSEMGVIAGSWLG